MISVDEALSMVCAHPFTSVRTLVPLNQAHGRILAEDLIADSDLPPFHRVMMDGIAVRWSALESGVRSFRIVGIQAAGVAPLNLENDHEALECMTGAMCPLGADVVIPYEDLDIFDGQAHVKIAPAQAGKNIHAQGRDARAGDLLVRSGTLMRSAEVGIAASVGKINLCVQSLPRIAVVSTGNELVDVNETPQAWQIRRSNAHALEAALQALGLSAVLFHCNDDEAEIRQLLLALQNEFDVLILSGGVSKGKFDFIPEMLRSLGITCHFHRVRQKPGKPIFFGSSERQTVFALPGNPVSTLVCFHRYFVPWWQYSTGAVNSQIEVVSSSDIAPHPSLTLFASARLEKNEEGTWMAHLVNGGGSGDFSHLHAAHGFVQVDAGNATIKKGSRLLYFPLL